MIGHLVGRKNLNKQSKIPFVDLFCGAGGLSAGFEMSGFSTVFANDNDSYACSTYRLNHPSAYVYEGSVEDLRKAPAKRG